VERAYKNFCAYRESQSQALVAHSPSKEMTKEMATMNDDGSEKEEESAGGRYDFMYLLILGKLLTLFLDSQLRKRAAKAAGLSSKKAKAAGLSSKKAIAAGLPSKKAIAAGLPSKKAIAAGLPSRKTAASAEVITQKLLKYVHNVACVNVINIPVSEN
jgi:hypothetical protein